MFCVGDIVKTPKGTKGKRYATSSDDWFKFEITSIEDGLLYNRKKKIYAVNPFSCKMWLRNESPSNESVLVESTKSVSVLNSVVNSSIDDKVDVVKSPKHYQLFPEFGLEIKDINKRLLDNMEDNKYDITLFEAGWYQQSMQYFERFYLKNGLEDLKKGIQTMQFVVDSMKQRLNKE